MDVLINLIMGICSQGVYSFICQPYLNKAWKNRIWNKQINEYEEYVETKRHVYTVRKGRLKKVNEHAMIAHIRYVRR